MITVAKGHWFDTLTVDHLSQVNRVKMGHIPLQAGECRGFGRPCSISG
jgi:hypothetical protein